MNTKTPKTTRDFETEDLTIKSKERNLVSLNYPKHHLPAPPPPKWEYQQEWVVGIGGVPQEPLPELMEEQKFNRFKAPIYHLSSSQEDIQQSLEEEKRDITERGPLIICTDLNEYTIHGIKEPIVMKDTKDIVRIIREYPELGFLYLKRCQSEEDIYYNPYSFEVCNYFDLDPNNFCTISPLGFTEFSPNGTDYCKLDQFERDVCIYEKLVKMSFFSKYYLWKQFSFWLAKKRKQKWLDLRQKMSDILIFSKHPHYESQTPGEEKPSGEYVLPDDSDEDQAVEAETRQPTKDEIINETRRV